MNYAHNPVEYRQMIVNAARPLATPPVRMSGQVGNIEVVVRTQGKRTLVHLVNYAGMCPRPFERVVPQHEVRAHLPGRALPVSARALMAGEDCPVTADGDGVSVELPVLHEYEVLAVE